MTIEHGKGVTMRLKQYCTTFAWLLASALFCAPALVVGQGKSNEPDKKEKAEKHPRSPKERVDPPGRGRPEEKPNNRGKNDNASGTRPDPGEGPKTKDRRPDDPHYGRRPEMGRDPRRRPPHTPPGHMGAPPPRSDDPEARAERRKQHLEQVKKRRKNLDKNPKHKTAIKNAKKKQGKVAEAQRKHLKRMSRLRRMSRIAMDTDNQDMIKKLRELQKKEMKRHAAFMKEHGPKRDKKRSGSKGKGKEKSK
jgi:hypothetical protein